MENILFEFLDNIFNELLEFIVLIDEIFINKVCELIFEVEKNYGCVYVIGIGKLGYVLGYILLLFLFIGMLVYILYGIEVVYGLSG